MEKTKIKMLLDVFRAVIIIIAFSFLTATSLFAGDENIMVIDKFSSDKDSNGIPLGWKLEEREGKAEVGIEEEEDNFYLRFVSRNSSFGLKKKLKFKIEDFPILSWRWKVSKLPEGGDVRKKSTDDQAAQVYVAFPKFPATINTRLIGYIWENEAPKGSMVTSKRWSKLKYIVLRDKTDQLNQWVMERRNVYEDYKKLFEEDPPKVGGISLYINSQHTESDAESCFDDVFFAKD